MNKAQQKFLIVGENSLEWWIDLAAILFYVDLEPWFGDQQDVLSPLETSVLELIGDLGVVELRHLEVDVPDVGEDAHHVGNTQL